MSEPARIKIRGQILPADRLPLVCTPLVAHTQEALIAEAARVAAKRPDILEWRIDHFGALGDTAAVIATARAIRLSTGDLPLIITRRAAHEGGQTIDLDDRQVVALYQALCAAKAADFLDYELSNPAEGFRQIREACDAHGLQLIGSYHNFEQTPDRETLQALFERAAEAGADIAKVAVMPQSLHDVTRLLDATLEASRTPGIPVISMSMGGLGAMTRTHGWLFGSQLTFAVGERSSAPGQIAIEDVREAVRIARGAAAI